MAVPNSKDAMNLAGVWAFNMKLSDDPDKLFAMQGVPWVVRQILKYASLSLNLRQAITLPDGTTATVADDCCSSNPLYGTLTTLHITQTVNPGGFDSDGFYPVDGAPHDFSLPIFGDVQMQLRYVTVADVADEVLREKLVEANPSDFVIEEEARNPSKGWEARVIWAFELVDGKRHLTRNVVNWNATERVTARMVYDYRVESK